MKAKRTRTDRERIEWLATVMMWNAEDGGLPARWEVNFIDRTNRDRYSSGFGGDTFRAAIDAAIEGYKDPAP